MVVRRREDGDQVLMTSGCLTDHVFFVIITGHRLRQRLPAGVLAVCTVRTRGQPHDNRCSEFTNSNTFKSHRPSFTSLLLLLPPSCHPQLMSVLSERPTIPAGTSKPTLTPSAESSIAVPDVVVNGKKQATSANLLHQRPASSSSNRSASANDEWGSNFWVTLVDPQVSTCSWLGLNVNTESDQTSLHSLRLTPNSMPVQQLARSVGILPSVASCKSLRDT